MVRLPKLSQRWPWLALGKQVQRLMLLERWLLIAIALVGGGFAIALYLRSDSPPPRSPGPPPALSHTRPG